LKVSGFLIPSRSGGGRIDSWCGRADQPASNLRGLLEFSTRHPAFKPLVLCDNDYRIVAGRLGLPAMDWRTYLLHGIPSDLA
jgi:hypothetical protein